MKPAHLLTVPFATEDYADGTVVRMPRTKLIQFVERAADTAEVADFLKRDLVKAMESKDTKMVAVGVFKAHRIPECVCPAFHAGFVSRMEPDEPRQESYRVNWALRLFPFHFDCLVTQEYPNVRVIEVVEYQCSYVI